MRIGYEDADSLITYPRAHNLSACECMSSRHASAAAVRLMGPATTCCERSTGIAGTAKGWPPPRGGGTRTRRRSGRLRVGSDCSRDRCVWAGGIEADDIAHT